MNDKENIYGIGCLILAFVIVGLTFALAIFEGRIKTFQIEAVQKGFAVWVADESGNTTFTWKEKEP